MIGTTKASATVIRREIAEPTVQPGAWLDEDAARNLRILLSHVLTMRRAWMELDPVLRAVGSPLAAAHFSTFQDAVLRAKSIGRHLGNPSPTANAFHEDHRV